MTTTEIVRLIQGHLNLTDLFSANDVANPLMIFTSNVQLALYIRKITSAHFKTRPDVSRVQLHDSKSIKNLRNLNVPVLVVGYCPTTEAVIIWPPKVITSRFNQRKNVSLYSRFSFQKEACKSQAIKSLTLSNNDIILGFHISAIANALAPFVQQKEQETTPTPQEDDLLEKELNFADMRTSDALKKIFQESPQMTFADAVEQLSSKRKLS